MCFAVLSLALLTGVGPQPVAGPSPVSVGVWYAGPGAQPPSTATGDIGALRRDLGLIRHVGFNAVTTWLPWADAEPRPGAYALGGVERLVAAAAEADLEVTVVVFTRPAPAWAGTDAEAGGRFVDYVRKRLSLQPGVTGVIGQALVLDRPAAAIGVTDSSAPDARLAMWTAIARGEQRVAFLGADPLGPAVLSLGETAGAVTRNQALFGPLRPRKGGVVSIAVAGGGAPVEVRLLESAEALMIIGLNLSPRLQKASIAFSLDIPEAIWQNIETGSAVNFVMGKSGPVLDHTFAPRDAVVLMIRKTPQEKPAHRRNTT